MPFPTRRRTKRCGFNYTLRMLRRFGRNAATYALLIDGMYSKTNHFNTIAYITYGVTALLLRQP